MMLRRVMCVLKMGRRVVGSVIACGISRDITIKCSLNSDISYADTLIVRLNDDDVTKIRLGDGKSSYSYLLDNGDIDYIDCLIIDSSRDNVVAMGSSRVDNDKKYLEDYYRMKSINKHTYMGDMVKSASVDMKGNEIDREPIVDGNMLEDDKVSDNDTIENKEETATCQSSVNDEDNEDKISIFDTNVSDFGIESKETDSMYSKDNPFYLSIKAQLDDLFSRYEHEKSLEDKIGNSMFSRIYYDEDKYYVVGEISDDNKIPLVICYGYPSDDKSHIPDKVEEPYDFLPMDRKNPNGKGYFMMYQNAVTGDVISN